jgi:hypothetical protein
VVWGINNAATTPLYGITTKPFDIYSPIDLSQLYYSFKLSLKFNEVVTSEEFNKTLDSTDIALIFYFVGHTVFSEMYPQPDQIGMNSIMFTDKEKIKAIMEDGFLFHVELSDNKNIQTARMFFLTTILSMLLAYWLALVTKVFKHYYDKLEKKHETSGGSEHL